MKEPQTAITPLKIKTNWYPMDWDRCMPHKVQRNRKRSIASNKKNKAATHPSNTYIAATKDNHLVCLWSKKAPGAMAHKTKNPPIKIGWQSSYLVQKFPNGPKTSTTWLVFHSCINFVPFPTTLYIMEILSSPWLAILIGLLIMESQSIDGKILTNCPGLAILDIWGLCNIVSKVFSAISRV